MNQKQRLKYNYLSIGRYTFILVLLLVFIFYLFFPNNNSSWDGYVYAAQTKYNIDLFQPHHLLYNPLLKVFYEFFSIFSDRIDILLAGKWMNSIIQVFNLIILGKLLRSLKVPREQIILMVLIVAFSYSPWRYGTENETYMVPITLSLLGSWFFLQYIHQPKLKWVILSSSAAAIACLFHQIHVFWWIGLLVGVVIYQKSFKDIIRFILPAITVPIAYLMVIQIVLNQEISVQNIVQFVLRDLLSGAAGMDLSFNGFLLVVISSVRTFFQVHPLIYILVNKYLWYMIPLLASLILGITLLIRHRRSFIRKERSNYKLYRNIHILILGLQFFMASYSIGNIEFMIMIPYLLIIVLSLTYQFKTTFLFNLVALLFLWNFFFGILPNHLYKFYDDNKMVEFIIQNPTETYLLKNRNVQAKYFYATGQDNLKNIFVQDNLNATKVDSLMSTNHYIITDIIDYAEIFNREKLIETSEAKNLFKDSYTKNKIFNYGGLFGETPVYKVVN